MCMHYALCKHIVSVFAFPCAFGPFFNRIKTFRFEEFFENRILNIYLWTRNAIVGWPLNNQNQNLDIKNRTLL